jgi:hydroxyethylthiazole kinase
MRAPESDPSHIAIDVIERLRERAPRARCITNAVAQAYTANFVLAAGAVPCSRARVTQ